MAAFPYQQHPIYLFDSVSLPNTPTKVSGSLEEGDISTCCFSCYPKHGVRILESYCLGSNTSAFNSDNEPSELDSGDQVSGKVSSSEKKRINRDETSSVSTQSKGVKQVKSKKQKKTHNGVSETEEKQSKSDKKDQKKVLEEPPSGYIHVRARRGQATDSHSLAERVRRERISERMKLLQGLVPGCDKVSGKALMLDEIINYVQSLQYQVEFLSMKLASLNPIVYDFGTDMDELMVKSEKVGSLASPLPSIIHRSNPTQPSTFPDTTAIPITRNNYCIEDNQVTFLLQQGQVDMSKPYSKDNENLLWDEAEQRQRLLNQCGFNNLCSFQ